ncbi:uncharacterized protein LOC129226646 [Uloborus diversus]|uniref:uncharacterized protein LOC129226646 n=1 Tax=Uloborus diversus TaxID=327109 RepID=UPI0024097362|nr:uncharacterized protein LOC129226646 [Uloborus diversus]
MYLQKTDYLLCVDYHSEFIEIKKLTKKTAEPVINALKQIFRTHGIPRRLHSDNGPPFDSRLFQNFTKSYDIEPVTSSPKYPKSNGMVEKAIGTMKSILLKVIRSKGDPNLAVLEYNSTPKSSLLSPSEMLMGRRLRTKEYYDRSAVKLSTLKKNQPVFVQLGHRDWAPGTVIEKLNTPRSYLVKTAAGSELQRNRIHLRPDESKENMELDVDKEKLKSPCTQIVREDSSENPTETLPDNVSTPKREKRIIRRPLRFQDYV